MLILSAGALLLAWATSAPRAEIYECIDQNGNKRFTNIKAEAKGCKAMNIAPAPVVSPPAPRQESRRAPAPANFPSVDAQTQKQRDGDRRRILEEELANEQKLLDEARKKLAEQEAVRLGGERNYQRVLDRLEPYRKEVRLHEDNIAHLRKELANLK
ncbi:MAG: DUF4124 domain-containing protein [Burkholderiales bacterium]